MGKFLTSLSGMMLMLFIVPIAAFAEEAGVEEAVAEPSTLLLTFLTVLSLATIIIMIYLCARDNG